MNLYQMSSSILHSCVDIQLLIFLFNPYIQVRYEWVKELLPRLHELDGYALSGCLAPSVDKAETVTSDNGDKRKTNEDSSSQSKQHGNYFN